MNQNNWSQGQENKSPPDINASVLAGSSIYSNALLAIYDLYVLGLSNTFAWRCKTEKLVSLYNENISSEHLDIGVGTGYYLDHCRFPSNSPRITLGDLNPNCLKKVSRRIARYHPTSVIMNVLDPATYPSGSFHSIGINYLLHCIPGPFTTKLRVLDHLKPLLDNGGILFGSTILGTEAPHNIFGNLLMKAYNRRGIFSNMEDNYSQLETALREKFKDCKVVLEGCVAMFSARA
jgi:ubiquinone/menaquinone biosynthesis C-methylase UbiE